MKKIVLLFAVLVLTLSHSYAQGGIAVLPFAEGKVLTSDDVGFLDLVSSAKDNTSRGAIAKVALGDSSFKAGDVLSKENAKLIEKAIKEYSDKAGEEVSDTKKAKVADGNARGCGYFCYYYYWNSYCGCYQYYYYYCCL